MEFKPHGPFLKLEKASVRWMQEHGLKLLRYSIAVVFIWFGVLKMAGFSPATELVANTVYWADPEWFVPFLGGWEVLIGVCFLFRQFLRLGFYLLAPQMIGTLLPLLLLPNIVFYQGYFWLPTLEGQYIIKNLVIISAALVIGAHLYDKQEKA
jgi:uncharacterized membrane protein YkgB